MKTYSNHNHFPSYRNANHFTSHLILSNIEEENNVGRGTDKNIMAILKNEQERKASAMELAEDEDDVDNILKGKGSEVNNKSAGKIYENNANKD